MSSHWKMTPLIGDCKTAALVSRARTIDWLCWPRLDSSACFAALLGTADHGGWLMEAVDAGARISRRYREHTLQGRASGLPLTIFRDCDECW